MRFYALLLSGLLLCCQAVQAQVRSYDTMIES